ncbi:MAG: diaminobutyrate--2-oxoglutarate transaminase [Nesterenkonia sp.]
MATDIYESRESQVRNYSINWPATFEKASGSYQITEDGTRFLDFFAGAGALNYGHNHPELRDILVDYVANDGVTHSMDMKTPPKRRFLETFERVILEPRNLDYKIMFPGPTGTNTVEAALKLARKVTGRQHILSFTNAFHGMTLGALSVTGNSMKRRGAGIPLTNSSKIPYDDYFDGDIPDFIWLERVLEDSGSGVDKPAAVIVETVQGEGGLNAARVEWLRSLADLLRRHKILLIVDDVQAGCGRTGKFFSFEEAGIYPDIVCVSKSISGYGLAMALTLFKSELDVWEPGEHNGTFRGNNLGFLTGARALELFWSDDAFEKELAAKIEQLREGLTKITEHVKGSDIRGRGFLTGVVFPDPDTAGKVAAEAYKRNMLVETSGPQDEVVKLMPPLTIAEEDLQKGLAILEESVLAATGQMGEASRLRPPH